MKIHLYCACISAVVVLIFATSGSLHLLDYKEPQALSVVSEIKNADFFNKKLIDSNIKSFFKENKIDFSYEYVKVKSGTAHTRPTTRDYYLFEKGKSGSVIVSKVVPSLAKRLLEFHKGHGRKFSRVVNALFGLCLIVTVFSGFWMGLQIKKIRKLTIITTFTSLLIFFIEFYS